MATTAILPKRKISLERLGEILKKEQESIARNYYMAKLREIVAPFDSRIEFRIESEMRNGDYITNISPTDDIAGQNAADTAVTSKELFRWLDEGTSLRWVGMPEDMQNETSPGSLATRGAGYDREEVYFFNEPRPGIDGRNFLAGVAALYENVYRNQIIGAIGMYIRN